MSKLNKKQKFGKTLDDQISKLKKSISNIDTDLKNIKKEVVWDGVNASTIIKKLEKQLVVYNELLSKLEDLYQTNYADDILLKIKF